MLLSLISGSVVPFFNFAKTFAEPTINEYSLNSSNANPVSITTGSDGAVWFTELPTNQIGRISTSGAITQYGSPNYRPIAITTGSDGAVWYTLSPTNQIGRTAVDGTTTTYSIPVPNGYQGNPDQITTGPDGALWFVEHTFNDQNGQNTGSYIERLGLDGTFTEFALPSEITTVFGITTGPDGALWFTGGIGEFGIIGRMTTSGAVSYFRLPYYLSAPDQITTGPDGALWFTESDFNQVDRITVSGSLTQYNTDGDTYGITTGPDGALWFTDFGANKIGRVTTSGTVNEFSIPTSSSLPQGITTGPDGALWFTENQANQIGQLIPTLAPSAPANLTAATPTNTSPVLSWAAASGATSYNIYRNGVDIGSSTTPSYTDSSVPGDGTYSYYVTAVNGGGESSPSNTISVQIDTALPNITYSLSPPANSNDWNNTPVTVTFTCNDPTSGITITSCSSPVTIGTDGMAQAVTGTATDSAGNTAFVTATVNLDQTGPSLGTPAWSANPVVTGNTTNLNVAVNNDLSGVIGGEYFIGSVDPGEGNGIPMTYDGSNINAGFSSLSPGLYQVNVRATDNAGNWSPIATTDLTVTPTSPTNLTALAATNKPPILTWTASPYASYYNIYRNDTDIGSSNTTTFTDNSAPQGNNSYYVTAVSYSGIESTPSNTVNVIYDTTPPTITYSVAPTPNSNGWNNTSVTVTFTCSDNGTGVGIASCTAPVTLSNNGSNQTVTGTAVDNAGNSAMVTTLNINIDTSVPMVTTPTWSTNPVVTGNNSTLTAAASASQGLSPIVGGEYYIGSTDPGAGNGIAMNFNSSTANLTANVGAGLSPGTYTFHVRAENAAGVWSSTVATTLTVNPATVAPTITSTNSYTTSVRQIISPSNFTVTTTGTPAPSLSETGALPNGLTFTDNGNGTANFTGMVAAGSAGTYNIAIKATNSAGSITQNFTLTITNANSAPSTIFTSTGSNILTATTGTNSSFTFTSTGNGKNFKLFLYSGSLPTGMNLHDNKDGTASITGTPTTPGTYNFTIESENGEGVTYQSFSVVVG